MAATMHHGFISENVFTCKNIRHEGTCLVEVSLHSDRLQVPRVSPVRVRYQADFNERSIPFFIGTVVESQNIPAFTFCASNNNCNVRGMAQRKN